MSPKQNKSNENSNTNCEILETTANTSHEVPVTGPNSIHEQTASATVEDLVKEWGGIVYDPFDMNAFREGATTPKSTTASTPAALKTASVPASTLTHKIATPTSNPTSSGPAPAAQVPRTAATVTRFSDGGVFPPVYHQCLIDENMAKDAERVPQLAISQQQNAVREMIREYNILAKKNLHRTEVGYARLLQMQILVTSVKIVPNASQLMVAPHRGLAFEVKASLAAFDKAMGIARTGDTITIKISDDKPRCFLCNSEAVSRCTRCMQVFYCSRECQKDDYFIHSKDCRKVGK
jgi:hypothetical protein